jgi:hypothetical protein
MIDILALLGGMNEMIFAMPYLTCVRTMKGAVGVF